MTLSITLTKCIKLQIQETIAEIDFFQVSPYTELLKNHLTFDDLRSSLKEKGLTEAAINNIEKHLQALGGIKHGGQLEALDAFPEKEYGKYKLSTYQNDFSSPFKYHVSDVVRVVAKSENCVDNFYGDSALAIFLKDESHKTICKKSTFSIIEIEGGNFKPVDSLQKILKIMFNRGQWFYRLEDQDFKMQEDIPISHIIETWRDDIQVMEVAFHDIQNDDEAIHHFETRKKQIDKLDIPAYGEFSVQLENVPLIPNLDSALDWFLYLLKEKIENDNMFYDANHLEQLWLGLYNDTPQFYDYYDIDYELAVMRKIFNEDEAAYWHIHAGIDLNPFGDLQVKPADRVTFVEDILEDHKGLKVLFDNLQLGTCKHLMILDRYINTLAHLKSIETLCELYPDMKITILTMNDYQRKESKAIEKMLQANDITRVIKEKNDTPHDRHWVIDDNIYICSKSIDFMKVEESGTTIQHTHFSRIDEQHDVEDLVHSIIQELKGSVHDA